MAFWKKSDDPWDRKPEKREETTWYEPPPAEEEKELTPEAQRIRDIIEGPKATPVTPEKCPWCSKDIVCPVIECIDFNSQHVIPHIEVHTDVI